MTANAHTLSLHETMIGPGALKPPPTRHALFALLLALAAVLLLGTAAWGDLRDGTEGEEAGAAREMLHAHQWIVPTNNGIARLSHPPLLTWLLVASFKAFGVTATAARLPIAAALIAGVALTFLIAERLFDFTRGFLAGLVHLCSLGTFVVGRVVTPEPVFSAFVAGAILCAICGYGERRRRRLWFVGFTICCALATLTTGIGGVLFPAAVCGSLALAQREARMRFRALLWWANLLVFFAIVAPWFIWCEVRLPGSLRVLASANFFGGNGSASRLFLPLDLAWCFPVTLLLLPGLIAAPRRLFRSWRSEISDLLPLSWMAVAVVGVLLCGAGENHSAIGLPSAFAIWSVNAWDHVAPRLRTAGVCAVICCAFVLGIVAAAGWSGERLPLAAWLSLRPVFIVGALSLSVAGGVAFHLLSKQRERVALIAVLAGMLPLGLGAVEAGARLSPFLSLAEAARALNDRHARPEAIYFDGPLREASSLLFYLPRGLRLVNQPPPPFPAQAGTPDKFVTADELLRRWSATEPVYLIVEDDRVPSWRRMVTERVHIYHQVLTCGQYSVLSNQF